MPLLIYALHLVTPIFTVTNPADHRTEEWFKISNKRFLSSQKCLDLLSGPPSLLLNGHRELFS